MTIASEIEDLQTNLAAAKSAVTAKGGTVGNTGLAGLATEIASIPAGGGVTVQEKDINFYDYDGTLVESWTLAELANKTSLPANPTHAGLTTQGWNWTLADLKAENAKMNVGQMYIPTDGKTHLFVEVDADHLTPNLAIGLDGTATIDWGDGTATTTITGSDESVGQSSSHTYASAGSYEVTIEIPEGSEGRIRGNTNYVCFLWKYDAIQTTPDGSINNISYAKQLKHLQVGPRMSLASLNLMTGLKDITLPSSITFPEDSLFTWFKECRELKFIALPASITYIGENAFKNCWSLETVSIPKSVARIRQSAFSNCSSLRFVTIPSSVTQYLSDTFSYCYSLKRIFGPAPADTQSFRYCYKLESISTLQDASKIAINSFSNCLSLSSIIIPSSVTEIQSFAFDNCRSLSVIDCSSATSVPTAGSYLFGNSNVDFLDGLVIKVPAALEADWKADSSWSVYASYIIGV